MRRERRERRAIALHALLSRASREVIPSPHRNGNSRMRLRQRVWARWAAWQDLRLLAQTPHPAPPGACPSETPKSRMCAMRPLVTQQNQPRRPEESTQLSPICGRVKGPQRLREQQQRATHRQRRLHVEDALTKVVLARPGKCRLWRRRRRPGDMRPGSPVPLPRVCASPAAVQPLQVSQRPSANRQKRSRRTSLPRQP